MKMEILRILPEKFDDVIFHLRNTFFYDEPLNLSVQLGKHGEPHQLLEEHSLSTLKDGFSLMAWNSEKNEIAGVVLNGLLHSEDLKKCIEKLKTVNDAKYKKIFTFLYEQNLKVDIFKMFNVETIFEGRILSVDSKYRGLNLGVKLIERSMDLAIQNNFKVMKIDASSLFSQKIGDKFDFKTLVELKYSDYKDTSGNPVFKVSYPHEKFQIRAIELIKN